MKVVVLSGGFNSGGTERQLTYLARALLELGHTVSIYTPVRGQISEPGIAELKVSVATYGHRKSTFGRLAWLLRAVKNEGPDLIVSYHGYMSLYAGLIGRVLRVRSVGGVRSEIDRFLRINGRIKGRFLLKVVNRIVFNSQVSMRRAIGMGVIRQCECRYLPNVVDLDEVRMRNEQEHRVPRIIYTGRIRTEKGLWDLLGAIKRLRSDAGTEFSLSLVGAGAEADKLRSFLLSMGWKDVSHLGELSIEDVFEELRQSDIFVFPSHSEGFPNSVLEAMACGLAVVSTRVGEVVDLIDDGEDGLLVPVGSEEALAKCLRVLIHDPEYRRKLGRNARKKVAADYSYDSLKDRLDEALMCA